MLPCAADRTGQYVHQLLEPAFSTVSAAADIPALFQYAQQMSGTLPFPVPDVFYLSQWLQDADMKHYLAPVSQSGAVVFSSMVHTVLYKEFPAGPDLVQAGQSDLHVWSGLLAHYKACDVFKSRMQSVLFAVVHRHFIALSIQ